jgi:hypothetical protein
MARQARAKLGIADNIRDYRFDIPRDSCGLLNRVW